MALGFYVTLLLAVSIVVRAQIMQHETYDYCDPKLKLCEIFNDHTMCKYPIVGLSSQCTPNIQEPLSPSEKKMILFWHNKFRSNVASGTEKNRNRKLPTSSNMRQIYWDKELETIATRWAEQCTSSTNTNVYDRCRNTKRFPVSQNIGTRRVNGTSIDKQAPQIVVTWFKESKDFDPALVDKFIPVEDDKVSVKQFSNIIWADVYAIGCARVIFQEALPVADKKMKRKTIWTIERLICNYGPGGNEIGKPVYKRGAPCENCPNGTHCSLMFPGLCAKQILGSEKSENQQNVENQEAKEEIATESEVSIRDLDVALSSFDANKAQSLSTDKNRLEGQEERSLTRTLTPNAAEDETVENTSKDIKTQLGQEKTSISDYVQHFDDEMKHLSSPKPTAGKTFGKKFHSDRNENEILNYSKRKWLVGRKSIRAVFKDQQADGSPCKCDDVIFGDSTRAKALNKVHFLFLFVIYLLIH